MGGDATQGDVCVCVCALERAHTPVPDAVWSVSHANQAVWEENSNNLWEASINIWKVTGRPFRQSCSQQTCGIRWI